ncbi:DUF2933 domain-containing protein [Nostoc sp. NIES-2111]
MPASEPWSPETHRATPSDNAPTPTWSWRSPAGTAVAALAAAAALYLITWHWQHTLRVLPYLALLACPLMHLFMHSGHHHGTTRANDAPDTEHR